MGEDVNEAKDSDDQIDEISKPLVKKYLSRAVDNFGHQNIMRRNTIDPEEKKDKESHFEQVDIKVRQQTEQLRKEKESIETPLNQL